MVIMVMMLSIQVGPGDDYTLTLGGFNTLSTLRDSMTPSGSRYGDYNLNGMKFTTK